MTREIKFRAWDKWYKKMSPVAEIQFRNGEVRKATVSSTSEMKDNFSVMKENLELMQYTGLKDIDGYEIFEGDIICGETTLPMEIVWHKSMWAVKYRPQEGDQIELIDDEFMIYMESEDWKVLGNIYENPELLK